jgi:Skp family chaperone for outer membrane proteins
LAGICIEPKLEECEAMSTAEREAAMNVQGGDSADTDHNRAEAGTGAPALPETNNIDKIREILFGVQMRDYEKRFSRLEERLLKESQDLRDETRKRFDALETFVKSEFEALSGRLQSEQRTRDESDQALYRELQQTGQTLERKLAQFDEQSTRTQRELRQQILEQSKSLSEEIRQKYEELSGLLDREVAELGNAKTDRASLASLFSELSLRLTNEFRIPGND